MRGRDDGIDPARRRVEEIKTFRGSLDRQRPTHRQLHWAQVKLYGWLACEVEGWDAAEVALVYLDLGSQEETVLVQRCTADELRRHFQAHCERFLGWAAAEATRRQQLYAALESLNFPLGDFRAGQRPLAEAMFRAAARGRCLLAQAPTGIGKTMGTLFPMLKAMPSQRVDRLFYLTAKTSGRQAALSTLAHMPVPLRVLELMARDKSCEHPDRACHGEACPLAKDFYDRLPAARGAALQSQAAAALPLTQAAVREVALAHGVCPYYLSQELARWADVVVGDYNYYFDHGGLLYGLTLTNQWRVGLLVDEAHNLVERARKMFSATLLPQTLRLARRAPGLAAAAPMVHRTLGQVAAAWRAIDRAQVQPYAAHDQVPPALLAALERSHAAIAQHLAEQADAADPALLDFHFEALAMSRAAQSFGPHSLFDAQQPPAVLAKPGSSTLCIRNIVPAPFLTPRLQASQSAALFSATLSPRDFHADLLGLPPDHLWVDVGSPFRSAQLQVHTAAHISTRYRDRARSLGPITDLIAAQFHRAPGNYLAFQSSHEYLEQVADLLAQRHPEVPQWRQSRRMSECAQREFLDRFTEQGRGVGFAVLGGAFSEGVDLPGRRLIGAFVATLGMPQVNPVNETVRARMQTLFGAGYDYTYFYPGMQKVVQAAGRVIRTTEDRGVLHLIDDRFSRPQVRRLFPTWWPRSAARESDTVA